MKQNKSDGVAKRGEAKALAEVESRNERSCLVSEEELTVVGAASRMCTVPWSRAEIGSPPPPTLLSSTHFPERRQRAESWRSSMATIAEPSSDNVSLFRQLDEYSWDTDEEFQGGLRAILGSVQDPAQVQHLTLRAKCYYYARKVGAAVDFDGYKRWVESNGRDASVASGMMGGTSGEILRQHQGETAMEEVSPGSGSVSSGLGEARKPASFAEICDMIAEGKPIPGIKDIPDTILEGQASESQTATRKKPWERSSGGGEKLSWMT
nr:hypothetical protein CFP56_44254 [Quercus suber]